eukprot:538357_1
MMNSAITVLERLVNELHLNYFSKQHKVLSSKLQVQVYSEFNCFSLSHSHDNEKCFANNQYEIIDICDEKYQVAFKYDENIVVNDEHLRATTYKIFVKNRSLFGINSRIRLQDIDSTVFRQCINSFYKHLQMHYNKLIKLGTSITEKNISNYSFILFCHEPYGKNKVKPVKRTQIKPDSIIFQGNGYIYKFDAGDNIHFMVPFKKDLDQVSIYVQFEEKCNFILIKQFDIIDKITKNKRKNQVDYFLTILSMYPYKIKHQDDFSHKVGVQLTDTDVSIIKKNSILREKSEFNGTTVLHRLVFELNVTKLSKPYKEKLANKSIGKYMKANKSIGKYLKANAKTDSKILKVLFLGAGSSGKSTLLRQIESIHGDNYKYTDDGNTQYFTSLMEIRRD